MRRCRIPFGSRRLRVIRRGSMCVLAESLLFIAGRHALRCRQGRHPHGLERRSQAKAVGNPGIGAPDGGSSSTLKRSDRTPCTLGAKTENAPAGFPGDGSGDRANASLQQSNHQCGLTRKFCGSEVSCGGTAKESAALFGPAKAAMQLVNKVVRDCVIAVLSFSQHLLPVPQQR
jgi:hypothetical protein